MKPIAPQPLAALVLALVAGLPAAAAAETDTAPASAQAPTGIRELLRGIRGMQRLPVAGVQMVEAGERVLFVSDNGRYVFTGPAWDLWHGAKLETLEAGTRLASRVDLKRLGLDPTGLGALDLGNGSNPRSWSSSTPAAPTAGASLSSCRRSPGATASAWCPCRCWGPTRRRRWCA